MGGRGELLYYVSRLPRSTALAPTFDILVRRAPPLELV